MSKLTPRVGDRVLIDADWDKGITHIGWVVDPDLVDSLATHCLLVAVDGKAEPRYSWIDEDWLTVVDCEPVEWPEGWGKAALADSHWQVSVFESGHAGHVAYFSYEHLVKILEEGPDVLEHWDELMQDSD